MRYIALSEVSELMLLSGVENHPKKYFRQKSQMLLSSHRGSSVSEIALSHGVGLRYVYRLFNAWEARGLFGIQIKKGRGTKATIDWSSKATEKSIDNLIGLHPQNVAKVAVELSLEMGKSISKRMIVRHLKKNRYSWKRFRKSLKKLQNPVDYLKKLAELIQLTVLARNEYLDMYFGDESYFNLSPEVPYGWQKIGEHIEITPKRTENQKIFGLLSRENKDLHTYEATKNINSQFIIDCIDDFATKIKKKTVIVLDNASTHTSNLMQEKIKIWKEQDIEIFFLPTYSPHLNLIETCWRKIKHEWLEPQDYDSAQKLAMALKNIFDNYGETFDINFSEFTNIELLLKSG